MLAAQLSESETRHQSETLEKRINSWLKKSSENVIIAMHDSAYFGVYGCIHAGSPYIQLCHNDLYAFPFQHQPRKLHDESDDGARKLHEIVQEMIAAKLLQRVEIPPDFEGVGIVYELAS